MPQCRTQAADVAATLVVKAPTAFGIRCFAHGHWPLSRRKHWKQTVAKQPKGELVVG
jgi:hypothetical protein